MFVVGPHEIHFSEYHLIIPFCLLLATKIRDLGKERIFIFSPKSGIKFAVKTKE